MTKSTDYLDLATEWLKQVYAELENNNVNLPIMMWLSAQTRLLKYNKNTGQVLPNVWLQGAPTIGKTYATHRAIDLLPPGTVREYKGVSARKFARDTEDLRHRIVLFEEADSLAEGKKNPLALSFRDSMNMGDFIYETQDNLGGWKPQVLKREGPFLIWSTSIDHPGEQLDARMEVISLPQPDARAIGERNAIDARIRKEGGMPPVPSLLIAKQIEWQKQADASGGIRIGFDDETDAIIEKLGQFVGDSRAFSRILFLLQALALTNERDKVIAADYDTLYDLNRGCAFLTKSLNAVTGDVREVADAIAGIKRAEEDAAVEWFEKTHPVTMFGRKLDRDNEYAEDGSGEWRQALKRARRNAIHSKITANDIAMSIGKKPTTTGNALRKAADAGWVVNDGGSARSKADWQLGPQYRATAQGLPTRWALLGIPEPGSEQF